MDRHLPDFLTRRDNDCEREILAGMPCRGAVKSAGKPGALQTLPRYPERLTHAQRLECGELAPAFERHEAGGQRRAELFAGHPHPAPFKSGSKLTALQTLRVGEAFRRARPTNRI